MRLLSLVRLQLHPVCLQADFHEVACQAAAACQGAGFHAADSTAHRLPAVDSAAEAVLPGSRLLRAVRTFPGRDPAGQGA